jgi:RimJ/RimL family protein N-acetyltransferase
VSDPVFRALTAADWPAFRDIRLRALRTEPGVFSANHDGEAARQPAWWIARVHGDGHQVFGAFEGAALAGTLGIFTWDEDPDGATAIIGMLFVDSAHRGTGLAAGLFTSALAWARERPGLRRVVVGHRASNVASMRAILRQGFRAARRQPHHWPDGTSEDEVGYVLRLGTGQA